MQGERGHEFFRHMYGDEPVVWGENLRGWERLRYITNAFTRLRYCNRDGHLVIGPVGPPEDDNPDLLPWYSVAGRKSADTRIVFGHWATLQQHAPLDPKHNVFHVDTACVWGGRLTALRLDDLQSFSVAGLSSG